MGYCKVCGIIINPKESYCNTHQLERWKLRDGIAKGKQKEYKEFLKTIKEVLK